MTNISLKEYHAKLESLLNTNATDEVIRHCRHILQEFPKNVTTYRIFGRALVYNSKWQKAGEVLTRVLSVYPDDLAAHIGLSEIYEKTNKPDEAIWHLERAFEQDPNNQPLIDALREMYQQHRKVEYAKVQLTTGAVARQYVR